MNRSILIACIVGISAPAHAEDKPTSLLPIGEIGASLPITHRESHPDAVGGVNDVPSGTSVGAAVRADISVLGIFLPPIVPGLRVGDLVGLELGIASGSLFVGHWIIGLQAAYDLTDVGFGFRAYSETVFDHMFGPSSSDLYYNLLVGEVSARYRRIVVRGRFNLGAASNAGYDASATGASIRVPSPWRIDGSDDWTFGADFDRYNYESAQGEGVLNRFIAVGAFAY